MQSVLSRIWTRVTVSISYDDNHYTTGTSKHPLNIVYPKVQVLEVEGSHTAGTQKQQVNPPLRRGHNRVDDKRAVNQPSRSASQLSLSRQHCSLSKHRATRDAKTTRNLTKNIWVFTNGPGDRGSIPDGVTPKTQKMVLDVVLLYTQHHKVGINGSGTIQGME